MQYASSDEQTAILKDLAAHLDSANDDAARMIHQQVLRYERVGCQLLADNTHTNLLPAHTTAQEAVDGTTCRVTPTNAVHAFPEHAIAFV